MRILHVAFALSLSVGSALAMEPDPCVPFGAENQFEVAVGNTMVQQASAVREMARLNGDQFDFCFTTGRYKTYFMRRPQLRQTHIRFSLDDFNEAYRMTSRPEDVALANLWIMDHEIGHAMAYYLYKSNGVVGLGTNDVAVSASPLLTQWRGALPQIQVGITTNGLVSEAFADCMSGFFIAGGVFQYRSTIGAQQPVWVRELTESFISRNTETLVRRVVSVGSDTANPKRDHGSPAERVSFVNYGMQVAKFYESSVFDFNNVRTKTATFLCAQNAYSTQSLRILGIDVPARSFAPLKGY